MDDQDDIFSSKLTIDATTKLHIRSLASWAMVIVVVTVIGYALNILELVSSPATESIVEQSEGFSVSILTGEKNVAGTIISIMIGLTINYFLYRFASTINGSITGVSQEKFRNSFRQLKIYFAITSIFMMLILLILLIAVLAIL